LVPPGSKTQANRHEGSPGTWEVCRLLHCLLSVRVSPNQKAPGPPGVRLLPEGAKDETRCRYRPANAMSQRDGRQKSECPRSTSAAGEPTRGSPSRGRRAPCHRTVGGKHGGDIEPRSCVNATTTDSGTGEAVSADGIHVAESPHRSGMAVRGFPAYTPGRGTGSGRPNGFGRMKAEG
jgi:hypothetical protein